MIKFLYFRHLIITIEVMAFLLFYLYGPKGHQYINQLKLQNSKLKIKISMLEKNILDLKKNIELLETEPFYKEKFAREYLQMANERDEIYV